MHQQDVQAVVNAMWAGGAEAMTLMGQRVISTSAVRCVGNTVVLHGQVYGPPFVVTAVGDPAAMRVALSTRSPGVALFQRYVDRFGLGFTGTTADQVRLPAYDGEPGPVGRALTPARRRTVAHDPRPRRRQLRQLRVQPRAVPRPARRGVRRCVRNDEPAALGVRGFDGVLLSPGPGTPEDAGASVELVGRCENEGVPLLGVCLGHQAIAVAHGATVDRAPELLHGKTSEVCTTAPGVLHGLPAPFTATRYHSLAVEAADPPG